MLIGPFKSPQGLDIGSGCVGLQVTSATPTVVMAGLLVPTAPTALMGMAPPAHRAKRSPSPSTAASQPQLNPELIHLLVHVSFQHCSKPLLIKLIKSLPLFFFFYFFMLLWYSLPPAYFKHSIIQVHSALGSEPLKKKKKNHKQKNPGKSYSRLF